MPQQLFNPNPIILFSLGIHNSIRGEIKKPYPYYNLIILLQENRALHFELMDTGLACTFPTSTPQGIS